MTNTIVYQIKLQAATPTSDEITVSLYSGETLAGQCKTHSGNYRDSDPLSCDRVTADRVRLTMTTTSVTQLYVYEIKVTGVPTMTIGLYLVSARIISSKTMRAFRDGVECRMWGSALIILITLILNITQISC